MRVCCPECRLFYDDTYRLTFCPHDEFAMQTRVYAEGREPVVATTVEELREALRGE